ncbi:MAG TPA: TRAP transporter TatT component family protein [Thermoanaerobaculia bacterium]|nr:TRAP transporter TatT component family protein [Thermoanaerobaculia bacterium]
MHTIALVLTLFAADSLVKQGQTALDRGDARTAVKLLEKAVADSPNDAEAHYVLGTAYGARAQQPGVLDRAALARRTRSEFEKAVSLDPNYIDARMALVQYDTLAPEIMGGSIQRAQQQADELLKRSPAAGHRAQAFIDGHLKQYDAAAAELREAAAIDPNDMPTLFEIGHLAAITGRNLPEGEQALLKYLEYTPAKGEPTHEQAAAYLEQIRRRMGPR